MGEQGVEDAKVGVPEWGGGKGEVEKIADHDVDEDAEIVGVKVFVGRGSGKEEIEEF